MSLRFPHSKLILHPELIHNPKSPKSIWVSNSGSFLPWTQSFHLFHISSHRSQTLAKEREKIIGGGGDRELLLEREREIAAVQWRGRYSCGGRRIDSDGERKPAVMMRQIWKLVQLWLKRQRNQKLFLYLCYVIFVSFVEYLLLKWVWFEYLLLKFGICYFQFGLSLILQRKWVGFFERLMMMGLDPKMGFSEWLVMMMIKGWDDDDEKDLFFFSFWVCVLLMMKIMKKMMEGEGRRWII